jgi:hypothetical protein
MTIPAITFNLINDTILSGSDSFRTAMGSYVIIETDSDDQEYFEYSNFPGSPEKEGMSKIESNIDLMEEVNYLSLFNSYKVPCRIYEDIDYLFDSHLWWEAYMMGGTYLDKKYRGVFEDQEVVKGDHCITDMLLPYYKYDSNVIDFISGQSKGLYTISITANYRKNYEEYIDLSNAILNERLLPNAYLFQTIEDNPDETDHLEPLWKFITLDNVYSDIISIQPDSLLDPVLIDGYLPPASSADAGTIGYQGDPVTFGTGYADNQFEDIDFNLRNYYSASLPKYLLTLSKSIVGPVSSMMTNVLFDQQAITEEAINMTDNIGKLPFYVTINFESLDATHAAAKGSEAEYRNYVKDLINSNNLSSKFIKDLRDLFGFGKKTYNESGLIEEMSFFSQKNYLTGANSDVEATEEKNDVNTTSLRTVDFTEFVNYAYINNRSSKDLQGASFFVGPQNIQRIAAQSATATYIHYNTINMAKFIQDFQELAANELSTDLDRGLEEDTVHSPVIKLATDASNEFSWSDYTTWFSPGHKKYTETLAYRIEKRTNSGLNAAGPSVLQDFWIVEGADNDDIILYDSQVKYDHDYTYNIYAYVLVCGNKYSVDDIRLSKPSGIVGEEAPGYEGWHCLQWYKPGDITTPESQLFETEEDNVLLGINTFADNTQSISETYRYLADFYLNFEASVKIIEIPIATKTLRILDNPPNMIDVNPFQIMDNSQTIGFSIRYDNFIKTYEYPKAVMQHDYQISSAYLHSLDLLNRESEIDNYINRESVSRQSIIEVYKIDYKPKKIADFDNQLYSRLDLSIERSKNTLSQTIFYDKIATNRKYYYLFRAVNQRGVPGYISEIYEAELVDDGAFKFSIFDALFEEELDTRSKFYTAPTKSFKKLFMLKPNVRQLFLDSTAADHTNPSYEEIGYVDVGDDSLEERIWNKTFKLRLTSKKTGKKMDLNITYKIVH